MSAINWNLNNDKMLFGINLEILIWLGADFSPRQAQNGVNFDA